MSLSRSMPISSPPQNYDLHPVGTSGTPVGPEVLIVDDDYKPLPVGERGNIMVRGGPCFRKCPSVGLCLCVFVS